MIVTLINQNCLNNCNICSYGDKINMDYEKINEIIDKLIIQEYEPQLYDLNITNDSIQIFKKTKQFEKKNLKWLNITTDFPLTKENIDYLNSLDIAICVSLHGSTPELHKLTSNKNDYFEIINFINKLSQMLTIPLGLNYVINRKNMFDLKNIVKLCSEKINISFIEFIPLGYAGKAKNVDKNLFLTNPDKLTIQKMINTLSSLTRIELELDYVFGPNKNLSNNCEMFGPSLNDSFCNAGINQIALNLRNMKVFPCASMSEIDELSLGYYNGEKIIFTNKKNNTKTKLNIDYPCQNCDKLNICKGGCRIAAINDNLLKTNKLNKFSGFTSCYYKIKALFQY